MQPKFDNLLQVASQWHEKGIGAVIATVVETWGSAPRRVGSVSYTHLTLPTTD